eukprot:g9776.t1
MDFAGVSSAALKKVHLKRLMAVAVALILCTFVAWELMIVCWAITPFMPVRGSGILGDFLSILVVSVCHSLAIFSRYLVCDADDAPRRRCRAPGGFSYSALALPNLGQGLATVVAHGLVGSALGLYAWNFVAARSGQLAEGSGALGGLVAGGTVCSMWSAVSFLKERRHHLRFGLPSGAALPPYLRGEALSSVKEGLYCGGVLAVAYLVLRLIGELVSGTTLGRALAVLLGLPRGGDEVEVHKAGRLVVAYLVFLSSAVNFGLHGFLTKVMNFIIVASQDFLRLWQASVAASDDQASASPSSPAALLLDSLSIGHESVLRPAEQDFLQARGLSHDGGNGSGGRASSYTRGPMDDWTEEVELQRRALALTCMEPPRTGRRGGAGGEKAPATRGVVVPVWAQVAKAQALQSLALRATCDRDLRTALYEVNIAQVLRALCLELDETSLLLQMAAFRKDPVEAARALGCEGRGDIKWLVEGMASSSSTAEAGRRWLRWLKDGLSPPVRGTLSDLMVALRPLFPSGIFGGSGGGGAASGEDEEGLGLLSPARLQTAIWAAEGMRALMVCAPGESKTWSLDTMLPVVLGSMAGLLLALQQAGGRSGGGGGGDGDGETMEGAPAEQRQQQQQLAPVLEKALTEVSIKYRNCLPDFRFPPVYAETINRLVLRGAS